MTAKRVPGVAFYGKVRIPTIGHRTAIDQAKAIAQKTGGRLTIGLSGTSEPLTPALKKQYAEKLFDHPVKTGDEHTKTLASFLSHLSSQHNELHLVAGSDRVAEYQAFLQKYNGQKDKKGKIPFNFKKWEVHGVEGERMESNKDPRRMTPEELIRTVSASKLESLAMQGNYEHFKAYHPGMSERHVRQLYVQIRRHRNLAEDISHKELAPMLDSFVSFASSKLGIKSLPNVRIKNDKDDYNSFAAYNPSNKELSVSTKNRHPMDVFRSVAHELVHHKQNEEGRIGKDIAKEGSTGSDIENEANSEAGKIMRWYAKENPKHFNLKNIIEHAVFVVGGPCSGKDYVIKALVNEFAIKEINLEALKNVKQLEERFIINASAESVESIQSTKTMLEEKGYSTSLIFVHVDDDVSKLRNEERATKGNRIISEEKRYSKWEKAESNLEIFMKMFETVGVFDNSATFASTEELITEVRAKLFKLAMSKKGKTFRDLRMIGKKRKYVKINEDFEAMLEEGKDTHKMEWGTDYLRKDYEKNTPGAVKKFKKKVVTQEQEVPFTKLPIADGIGPEVADLPLTTLGIATRVTESIEKWANDPKTQKKFIAKYGENAAQKLEEAALKLQESGCGETKPNKTTIRKLKESAAWQRKEGQSPSGGLNKKGIESYRRENPGSKLSMAVTTKPSKLDPDSKPAKRRKSFCARMGGVKGPMKDENGKPTRKALALRKWNCEE